MLSPELINVVCPYERGIEPMQHNSLFHNFRIGRENYACLCFCFSFECKNNKLGFYLWLYVCMCMCVGGCVCGENSLRSFVPLYSEIVQLCASTVEKSKLRSGPVSCDCIELVFLTCCFLHCKLSRI